MWMAAMHRGVCAILWLGALVPLQAQETQPEVTVDAISVLVDVVVTDDLNRLVTDLDPADFELFEDGVPQRIDAVVYVGSDQELGSSSTRANEKAEVPSLPAKRERTPIRASAERQGECKSPIVFLLDLTSAELGGRVALSRALTDFLGKHWAETDCGAVFSLEPGFTLRQGFTSDKNLLLEAVRDLNRAGVSVANAGPGLLASLLVGGVFQGAVDAPSEYQAERLLDSAELLLRAGGSDVTRGILQRVIEQYLRMQAYVRRRHTNELLQAVQAIARAIAPLGRRTSLILASHGFVVGPETEREFFDTAQMAGNARLAVYVLDPQGLEVRGTSSSYAQYGEIARLNADFRSIEPVAGDSLFDRAKVTGSDVRDSALRYLAAATGGFVIRNTNDLSGGLRRIYAEAKGHYLLTYRPTRQFYDGEFRRVEVRIRPPGLSVAHREGYRAVPPGWESLSSHLVRSLLEVSAGRVDLSLAARFSVHWFPSSELLQPFLTVLELPLEAAHWPARSGEIEKLRQAQLRLSQVIFEEENGTVVAASEVPIRVEGTAEELQTAPPLTLTDEWRLPPGGYRLEVLLEDENGAKAFYRIHELDVTYPREMPAIGDLVLGKRVDVGREGDTLLEVDGGVFIPSLDGVFQQEDPLLFLARICRRKPVEVSATIRRAEQREPRFAAVESSLPGVPAGEVICENFARSVSIAALPPGTYFLELAVRDPASGAGKKRQESFQVLRAKQPPEKN